MPNDCHIGIDWGTHSSKLCIHYGLRCIAAPIFSSDIVSTRGRIVFGPEEHPKQDQIVRGLKGDLIKNSLTEQFWGNQSRPDTGTSLGEAVALSLTCLVAEAKRLLTVAGAGSAFADAELGFSFPNSPRKTEGGLGWRQGTSAKRHRLQSQSFQRRGPVNLRSQGSVTQLRNGNYVSTQRDSGSQRTHQRQSP